MVVVGCMCVCTIIIMYIYIYMHYLTSYACDPVPHGDRSTIVESKRTLEFKWHRLVLFFQRHLHFTIG